MHHFVAIRDFKLEIQSGTAQFGLKSIIFRTVWPCNLTYDLEKKTIEHLFYATSSFVHHFVAIVKLNLSCSPETANLGPNRRFFSRVTLQFDVWPWKTIGHLFYSTSSSVHHLVAIGVFKLELQSGNAISTAKKACLVLLFVILLFIYFFGGGGCCHVNSILNAFLSVMRHSYRLPLQIMYRKAIPICTFLLFLWTLKLNLIFSRIRIHQCSYPMIDKVPYVLTFHWVSWHLVIICLIIRLSIIF